MSQRTSGRTSIDWITFSLYLSLVFIGWFMVYAAEFTDSEGPWLNLDTPYGRQLIFISLAFGLLLLVLNIDWKFWRNFAYPIYVVSIASLLLVLLLGVEIKGAKSWFFIGGFSLQPAEFAKFATCLALSVFIANPTTKLTNPRSVAIAISLFVAPVVLILLQPDAGSAMVFFSFLVMLYRAGLSPLPIIIGFLVAVIFILSLLFGTQAVFIILLLSGMFFLVQQLEYRMYWNISVGLLAIASLALSGEGLNLTIIIIDLVILLALALINWYKVGKPAFPVAILVGIAIATLLSFGSDYAFNNVLEPHQQERLNVWLNPSECDPHGPLYNVMLSKMAIGSGGLTGKGYLNGTLTKLNYVPEQSTDFIFCTVGEEQGFIGSITILSIFLFLIIRILQIAERQRLSFFRNFAYGVAGILLLHFTINVGMTVGLVPIIGIPLPFLSYGGSSLLAFTLMIGVLLRFDSQRSVN
ncbi:MAG: rod shape-determining protein RodA [Saprospiraceae bacterium]|nr:rod shape-determining protein RodA [Saprospiraceae bacterium]